MKANKGNSKSTKNSIINKTSTWLEAVKRSRNKTNQREKRENGDKEILGMNNNRENHQMTYERPLSKIDEITKQVDERVIISKRPPPGQAKTKQVYPRMVNSIMPTMPTQKTNERFDLFTSSGTTESTNKKIQT